MMDKVLKYNPFNLGRQVGRIIKDNVGDAYRKAFLKGHVEVVYCRVMLLGPGGVGKTSLKRGLMGMELDQEANSTIVADVKSLTTKESSKVSTMIEEETSFVEIPSFEEFTRTELESTNGAKKNPFPDGPSIGLEEKALERKWVTEEWREVTDDDEIEELARLMACIKEHDTSATSQFGSSRSKSQSSKESTTLVDDSFMKEYRTTLKTLANSNILDKAIKLSKTMKSSNVDPKPSPYFHMWDCGGQPVFQEVLPVFLTSRTMFLLVFNANRDLSCNIESVQYRFGERIQHGYVNLTTLQLMEGWTSNIHSYLLDTDKDGAYLEYPRVIPVGTRGDQLSLSRKKEVKNQLDGKLYDKAFRKVLREPIIVDNTTAGKGDEEDPVYGYLRQSITQFATEKLIEITPITWVLYRKVLQLLAKNDSTDEVRNTITFPEAVAIGSICKVEPGEVHAVLSFYHELGVLLYYPHIRGLENKIILDPRWFVECLGLILTLPGVETEERERKKEWELLRTKGILVQPLYAAVWKECKGVDPGSLIELLVVFQLAVKVQTELYDDANALQFFIPAVLPYIPLNDGVAQNIEKSRSVASLHITFQSGYVIPGFFTRFVTRLAKPKADNVTYKLYFNEGIYHNRVTFRYGVPDANLVTLTDDSSVVKVDVRRLGHYTIDEIRDVCLELKAMCEKGCIEVKECLQHERNEKGPKYDEITIKIVCQHESCSTSDFGIHYLDSHPFGGQVCCSKNNQRYRAMTETESVWFEKVLSLPSSPTGSGSEPTVWTRPDPFDVCKLLRSSTNQWDEIGRELEISYAFRETLTREAIMTSAGSKLERIIREWLESESTEVSWQSLIDALIRLERKDTAKQVKSFLLNDPIAKRKYAWEVQDKVVMAKDHTHKVQASEQDMNKTDVADCLTEPKDTSNCSNSDGEEFFDASQSLTETGTTLTGSICQKCDIF